MTKQDIIQYLKDKNRITLAGIVITELYYGHRGNTQLADITIQRFIGDDDWAVWYFCNMLKERIGRHNNYKLVIASRPIIYN